MGVIHFSKLVFAKAKKRGSHRVFFSRDNAQEKWFGITWDELADKVLKTARAMVQVGVKESDNIGICCQNMVEGVIADFANFANRAVSVPMYATLSSQQIEYIVNDAEIALLFVGEQQQYDCALEVLKKSEFLKQIVVFDSNVNLHGEASSLYFSDFMAKGEDNTHTKEVNRRQEAAQDSDLAIIMYTSGTTGEPKGVMLPHRALLAGMRIHKERLVSVKKGDKSISFLPLSHIFERAWVYFCMTMDVKIYLNLRPLEIQRSIKEIRPTLMCSVPRFWEKVAAGVQEKVAAFPPFKQGLVSWALATGKSYNLDYLRLEKNPPLGLRCRYFIANSLIFNQLKKTIGIERGNMFPTAGAALDDKLAVFFRSMGIPICYGYGLTETTATVCCYDYTEYRIGTVGSLMPEVQVKIGEDNEILVKAETVTSGYYKKPEATAEAFIDGWFRTGDSGKLIDGKYVVLVDRIKDLFKTSNGKYIAPQQIETKLGADRYIEQIAVIGNNRNYVTAIIAPNIEADRKSVV